nr:protein SRG1-like [Ipomoea batatas]
MDTSKWRLGKNMLAWSNGVYKSIEHRAVTNQTKARISVATLNLRLGVLTAGWRRENQQLARENHWLYLVCRRLSETMLRMFLKDTYRTKMIINLSLLENGDEDELRKLDFASKEWGFFQIMALQNMEAAVASFFKLPVEDKENDIATKIPKYWPPTLVGFREAVEQYAKEIETVTTEILANLSLLMGMEKHSLRQMHGEMKQGIRLNYYSPCAMSDLVLGVRPHSDINSISLLLQEDEITGLQIRHKESWVPVNPIPISKCVVNIGDVMEGCSNWVYKNIEHRAVTNQTKARISTAAFVIPEDQSVDEVYTVIPVVILHGPDRS